MALNKEIWVNDIIPALVPNNSFISKGTDYSAFADNETIHIPVQSGSVNVAVDRSTFPGTVTASDDGEEYIKMHTFTTDPLRIYNPEDVQLSYGKREVYIRKITDAVNNKIAEVATEALAYKGLAYKIADQPSPVSNPQQAASVLDAVRLAATSLDSLDYPDTDRYVMLSAESYATLLKELSDTQTNAFLACADMKSGVAGQIYGFNIMKRSSLTKSEITPGILPTVGDMYAWHKSMYKYALGGIELFVQENAPEYYGTVISAAVRFGAAGVN